ncbi:MAG: hypothetical protein HFI47_06315 [Lachnospiraceae bacterium]|jgi:hypothetical protein|nr:hypothetical protein [Lachnospiraceae bacterium]
MNCLILLALLCCGEGSGSNCFGMGGCRRRSCTCRPHRPENNCGGRDNDCCECRQDVRPEPRLEPRPFPSYQGSSCGCEAQENNGCN